MDLPIVPFDPRKASREEWGRYHAYRRVRDREEEPDDPLSDDATVEAWMSRPHPHWEDLYLAVLDPSDPSHQVGNVYYEIPRPGSPSYETNRHIGWAGVSLLREWRKRGLGSRLLPEIVRIAHERGQTVLQSWCGEADGKAFAARIGAKVVQQRRENRLSTERVDWTMAETWVREGEARNPDTTLRWFVNAIDDDIVDAYAKAFTETFNLQPFGKADHGEYVFTRENFRDRAERVAATRGTWITGITVERDGGISSLTETSWTPDRPTFLSQGLTGVPAAHRGRGLGKWTKAAMLLRIRKERPQVRTVVTGNASSNAAMLSINERLGFRVHKEPVVVEIGVPALEAFLAGPGTSR